MTGMRRFCSILLLTLCLLLMIAVPAMADWENRSGETVIIKAGETVTGDLWSTGATVIIDGTVNGDLLVAATNVTINGEVKGSVIGVVYNYLQRGLVRGNVRVVATNNLTISGTVGKNVSAWYLNQFDMGPRSKAQSLRAFGILETGRAFTMNGDIRGKVFAKAMEATVNGRVGGNCTIMANKDAGLIRIKSKAHLHSLQYVAAQDPKIDPGAVVGVIKKLPTPAPSAAQRQQALLLSWMWFLGTLIIGFILIRILPFRAVEWASGNVRWMVALGIGLAVMVGGILLSGFLFLTGIGMPLALLIGSLYLSLILIGPLPAYIYIGGVLVRLFRVEKRFPVVFLLLVGGVVVFLLSTMPNGFILTLLTTALGMGLFLLRTPKIIIAKAQSSPENAP
jgi:cytoskeletal protein CcmA (bactofilin family)